MANDGPKPLNGRLRLDRVPWDSLAAEHYRRIPMDSPAEHAGTLEREVIEGRAQAWRIWHDDKPVGLAITRTEEDKAKEFVICAMYSESEYPMSAPTGRELERIARAQGCISIRFHTCRHALARAAAEIDGYRLCEIIMRKTLT